jgi:hypothetical protein
VTDPAPPGARLGFEAFGAASGLAVVVGALSLVAPYLGILTATLAALAVAGWAVERRFVPRSRGIPRRTGLGILALGVGALLFLDPPPELRGARGLLLGLAVAAFWAANRVPGSVPSGPGGAFR